MNKAIANHIFILLSLQFFSSIYAGKIFDEFCNIVKTYGEPVYYVVENGTKKIYNLGKEHGKLEGENETLRRDPRLASSQQADFSVGPSQPHVDPSQTQLVETQNRIAKDLHQLASRPAYPNMGDRIANIAEAAGKEITISVIWGFWNALRWYTWPSNQQLQQAEYKKTIRRAS